MRGIAFALIGSVACSGAIEESADGARAGDPWAGPPASQPAGGAGPGTSQGLPPAGGIPGAAGVLGLGANGITRLSRAEYRSTVQDLLGVDLGSDVELLPADSFTPFDNDYTLQTPSTALIEGLQALAERAVTAALADPSLRAALVGCTPSSPDDATCLGDFIRRFGRRALRRPLADDEVQRYQRFQSFASASGDFHTAVSMIARAMLQDMEFIYRVELGEPIAGQAAFRLDDFETATRLSYLLWGQNPDEELLDRAAAGELRSDAGVRAAAERMLDDERGKRRIERFHALWLGYDTLPHAPELNGAMRRETDALLRRVVFDEQRPWLDLFSADETFVNGALGALYGLPVASGADFAWVRYPTQERRGILSHGSLLSNGVRGTDTSPTRRGKFVSERLACTPIPPPPDDVNADEPPPDVSGQNCKADRYEAHRTQTRCAGCHALMDGIGFGLENYDARGAYRNADEGKPECEIDGMGELQGKGAFSGPAELASLLAGSGDLTRCLIQRLFQLGVGRDPLPADMPLLAALADRGGGPELQLRQLLLDWVSSEGFRIRTVDER
jgi:hypothetical protein